MVCCPTSAGPTIVRGSRPIGRRISGGNRRGAGGGDSLARWVEPARRAASTFQASRTTTRVSVSSFPQYRPRRLRRTAALRNLVRETHLAPAQLVLPVFVRDGQEIAPSGGVDAGRESNVGRRDAARCGIGGQGRRWRNHSLRSSRDQGRDGLLCLGRQGCRADGRARAQERNSGSGRDHRRLHVRVHGSRPLRSSEGRRRRQRRDPRAALPRGSFPRASRRRCRRAERHDGWPRGGDPIRAGRRRLFENVDPELRGEVRVGLLRTISRGRRVGAADRRSPRLSDGSGQRRGGAARSPCRTSRKEPMPSW